MSLFDRPRIRRAFSTAARGYAEQAVLQREVESRLLERLEYLKAAPARVLDAGCGPGRAAVQMRRRFRRAQVVAMDLAEGMLAEARRSGGWWHRPSCVQGDLMALPFADASFDLVFSSLVLQWCEDVDAALDECRRVLRPGGLLLLASFGPDTLRELREVFADVDGAPHVSPFPDLHVLGDRLLAGGFRDPVIDNEHFTLTYKDARQLMRELKAIGAGNALAGRRRSLTGKVRMLDAIAGYERFREDGRLPATYEVVYAMAFGPEPGQPRRHGGADLAYIPADRIPVRRRRE
ncbi:MAG TPA: malonyl-ACP O-methyltransferase BioC [Xanthomonadaceae bacterium]|nr:malonyl-ACP O-methyltransferase BioC [Xanthomonadaceae bacterium]